MKKELTAENIKVHVLDWKKIDALITKETLESGVPNRDGGTITYKKEVKFVTRDKYGMIEEPYFALFDNECCGYDSTLENFKIDVYTAPTEEIKDGKKFHSVPMFPSFVISLTREELAKYKTGETKTLKDFMGSRYNYNSRIRGNLSSVLRYFNSGKFSR